MAEQIAIDKNTFFNHLSGLYASWKADQRSGNAAFGGAGSIVILMGKTKADESAFQKNNALHVCHHPSFSFDPQPGHQLPLISSFADWIRFLVLASRI